MFPNLNFLSLCENKLYMLCGTHHTELIVVIEGFTSFIQISLPRDVVLPTYCHKTL